MSQSSLSPHEPAVALSDIPNTKAVFAAIVAAAGNHPLLIVGGDKGKRRQLARAVTACLPPLTRKGYAAIAFAHGTRGLYHPSDAPPFQRPLVGLVVHSDEEEVMGRYARKAGDVHLAHGGTLYIDDFSKCRRNIREKVLRGCEDPDRQLPADFWLVGGAEKLDPVININSPTKIGFEVVINFDEDFDAGRHLGEPQIKWLIANAAKQIERVRTKQRAWTPDDGGYSVAMTLADLGLGNGLGCFMTDAIEEEARLLGGGS